MARELVPSTSLRKNIEEEESDDRQFHFMVPRGKCHVCGSSNNGRFKIPRCKSTRAAMIVQLKLPKCLEEELINRNHVQLCSIHFPKSAFMIVKGKKVLYDRRVVLPFKMPEGLLVSFPIEKGEPSSSIANFTNIMNSKITEEKESISCDLSPPSSSSPPISSVCAMCEQIVPANSLLTLPENAVERLEAIKEYKILENYIWEVMIAPSAAICIHHITQPSTSYTNFKEFS